MNNGFKNINTVPRYVTAIDSVGNSGVSLVNNENSSFPQVSNLVESPGITVHKNEDNSITIGCTTIHNLTYINLTDSNVVTFENLDGTTFSPVSPDLNFAHVVETSTHVDISGAISLEKTAGAATGTLGVGTTSFYVKINHNFPQAKDYSGAARVGGVVGFYTEDDFVTCTRNYTPTSTMQYLHFQVNTNITNQYTLPTNITRLNLEFSLRYQKALISE